jgi:F-type H+-transporting ATPase subunit epsilon
MKTFTLTISRVDGPVFSGAVRSMTLPGIDGEMTILPDHTALISPLSVGTLTITDHENVEHRFPVTTGTLEVSSNQATVLL